MLCKQYFCHQFTYVRDLSSISLLIQLQFVEKSKKEHKLKKHALQSRATTAAS